MSSEKDKKHRGLGRLLRRDRTPERPDPLPDSAYGSSEANSADGNIPGRSTPEIVSAEKDSEIANIDQDRNLALKPSTGEVFDEDTGEVVTVVTTTTTTTTTTTRKGGNNNPPPNVQRDVQRDVKKEVQPAGRPALSEMPAGSVGPEPASLQQQQQQPAMTATNTAAGRPQAVGMGGRPLGNDLPPVVPVKSAMRRSGELRRTVPAEDVPPRSSSVEYGRVSPVDAAVPGGFHTTGNATGTTTPPVSPTRPNYSYPSRSSLRTADQPMRHNQNTIDDLRAAAKGIHGVGETLRGTLTSTIDRRFPSKNADKAALANAHNDQILDRGRAEMEGIPGGWPAHDEADVPGVVDGGVGGAAADGAAPPERSRGLGKLFKRKPVGEPGVEAR